MCYIFILQNLNKFFKLKIFKVITKNDFKFYNVYELILLFKYVSYDFIICFSTRIVPNNKSFPV